MFPRPPRALMALECVDPHFPFLREVRKLTPAREILLPAYLEGWGSAVMGAGISAQFSGKAFEASYKRHLWEDLFWKSFS